MDINYCLKSRIVLHIGDAQYFPNDCKFFNEEESLLGFPVKSTDFNNLTANFTIWDNSAIQHLYGKGISPQQWTCMNFRDEIQIGIITPYVENELLNSTKIQLEKDGGYVRINTPPFIPGSITYYSYGNYSCANMTSTSLVWIWLTDGINCFWKNNMQVYFGPSLSNSINITNFHNYGGKFYRMVVEEIAIEMLCNSSIDFPVGGAIKIYNFTNDTYKIYLCSRHTANTTKSQGDFPIFLSWVLYQTPVITDDKRLYRDLKSNGARNIYSIILKY